MKLELGKQYKDRLGNIVTITGDTSAMPYAYSSDSYRCYTETGKYIEGITANDEDLVEEVNSIEKVKQPEDVKLDLSELADESEYNQISEFDILRVLVKQLLILPKKDTKAILAYLNAYFGD